MSAVPSAQEIEQAAERIAGLVRHTPVLDYEYAAGQVAALKLELFQHAGSFKPRGAFNTVLSAAERPSLLVAASGGNHGLAVAHVGSVLGIPTEIHVPTTAPAVKVEGIRARGATVVQTGDKYADALAASQQAAALPGALAVHAYDALGTVTGQGTVGQEIGSQVPDVDTVLVAVGGGGLIGGIAAWFAGRFGSQGRPVRIVAVEPVGCPTLHDALLAGKPVIVEVGGVAADALGASRIGELGLASAQAVDVRSVLVDDEAIRPARQALFDDLRIAAEPAGAAALAALRAGAYRPEPGERVVAVVCGGNADPSDLGVASRA